MLVGIEQVKVTKSSWRDGVRIVFRHSVSGDRHHAEENELKQYMPEAWYNFYATLKAEREL